MKKYYGFLGVLFLLITAFAVQSFAQGGRETFTGTIISYGSGFNTRTTTGTFTLNINGQTSDQQAQRLLGLLQERDQNALLKAVDDQDLGRFSVGARVGEPINVVRETMDNGRRRIFVVFRRSPHFAELRGGYRSLDYPFGVIEMFIDPRTGKGEGTYIAAARIRWDRESQNTIEIENFATYPARLMGVTSRGRSAR